MDQFFQTHPSLTAYNSQPHTPNKFHIFGNVRTWGFTSSYPGYFSLWANFEEWAFNEQFFLHFFVATPKKNSSGRRSDNIEDWRLPHFEADVPTFSKYLWKLAISLKLPTPKLDDPGPLPPKWVFLDQFNEENNFFGTFWPNEYPQVLYMVGKLRISSFLIK